MLQKFSILLEFCIIHRIMEWVDLERTLRIIYFHRIPCCGQNCQMLDQDVQDSKLGLSTSR